MSTPKIILILSAISVAFFVVLTVNYLYFCLYVENPKEITVNEKKIYISYESRPFGKGTEALTTVWREDSNGRRRIIEVFRNADADNHLGPVTLPQLYFYDCNGDGQKDLCRGDANAYIDLNTETLVEQADIRLPYLYQSYIKWHNNWSFSFPKFSFIVPIFVTAVILWITILGIFYLIRLLIHRIKIRSKL
jgi:hypothetical protein